MKSSNKETVIGLPIDVKEMTEMYSVEKGGICGQSCLATIEGMPIHQVLADWVKLFGDFKGWSTWKGLRKYLENKGYDVKQKNGKFFFSYHVNYDCYYILRVQWFGNRNENRESPFYGWNSWFEASAHTHFILFFNGLYFCNEEGVFSVQRFDRSYLQGDGIITSALEVKNGKGK